MSVFIEKSDMMFGPFDEKSLFHVEKSSSYTVIQSGMKIAEFIVFNSDKNRIEILEVKKSAPNPKSTEKPERFSEYISEIDTKFCNSMELFFNQLLKKNLSEVFRDINYSTAGISFVLLIKTQLDEWIPPVCDALEFAIRKHLRLDKIWKCKIIFLSEKQVTKFEFLKLKKRN